MDLQTEAEAGNYEQSSFPYKQLGDQAIHLAATLGSTIIVYLLLNAGANSSAKNSSGLTAAEIGGKHGFQTVVIAIQIHKREMKKLSHNSQASSSKYLSQVPQGQCSIKRNFAEKGKSQKRQIECTNATMDVGSVQLQGINHAPVKTIQGFKDNQVNTAASRKKISDLFYENCSNGIGKAYMCQTVRLDPDLKETRPLNINKHFSRKTTNEKASTDDQKNPAFNVPANSQGVTRWSSHHLGDVNIPEICIYSVDSRCRFERKGCHRLHSKTTSHWQIFQGSMWINLLNFQSKQIEDAFVDVNRECVLLNPIHPGKHFTATKQMLKILGNDRWQANFETMMLARNLPNTSYPLRRLSTPSAAVSKSVYATTYEWYFLDNENKWEKYGETGGLKHPNERSNITSQEIEVKYMKDKSGAIYFQTAQFQYSIDLKIMQQINMKTKRARPVRRRPVKHLMINHHSSSKKENNDLPSHWSHMKETDTMILVTLQPSSQEFREVMTKFHSTLKNKKIHFVKRVQSPFLWRPFKIKEEELTLKYGGRGKLHIQKLFHGTKSEYVTNICKENFDWRLHGSNVGQLYGRGAYFSNSADYASGFCTPDWRGHCFMFLVEVIVGRITKGDSSMKRPPQNPSTGELYDTTVDNLSTPNIFVKYDKQEYYPLYIIEYS